MTAVSNVAFPAFLKLDSLEPVGFEAILISASWIWSYCPPVSVEMNLHQNCKTVAAIFGKDPANITNDILSWRIKSVEASYSVSCNAVISPDRWFKKKSLFLFLSSQPLRNSYSFLVNSWSTSANMSCVSPSIKTEIPVLCSILQITVFYER